MIVHILLLYSIYSSDNICSPCCKKIVYQKNRKTAPDKFTSPERLRLTLQDHRLKRKQLEDEPFKMRTVIETHSEIVDIELNQDFQTIFSGCDKTDVPNFMKLLWE